MSSPEIKRKEVKMEIKIKEWDEKNRGILKIFKIVNSEVCSRCMKKFNGNYIDGFDYHNNGDKLCLECYYFEKYHHPYFKEHFINKSIVGDGFPIARIDLTKWMKKENLLKENENGTKNI